MKKTYMQPSIKVVKVKVEAMLVPASYNNTLGTQGVNGSAALGRERGTRNGGDDFDDLW